MKALVIKQPWAWAIMQGIKTVENRSWLTKYRGPLVVIAGASKDRLTIGREFTERLGIVVPADLPRGCILGVVNLDSIVLPSEVDSPFAEGPWCWCLSNPVKLEQPVPYRGQLGLFEVPQAALRQTESLAARLPSLLDALA